MGNLLRRRVPGEKTAVAQPDKRQRIYVFVEPCKNQYRYTGLQRPEYVDDPDRITSGYSDIQEYQVKMLRLKGIGCLLQ